jgi:hypothetical protein
MSTNLKEMMERARERVWEWLNSRQQTDLEKYLVLKGAKSPADVEHWIREYTYKNSNSLT